MLNSVKPYSKYVRDAIQSIKEHIDANPFQYKSAAELLEQLNSPHRSSVEKAFKDIYGTGIKEYQVRQRLEASKKMLAEGMTKKQIASKCYYSCQASYSRAFKKEFRLTPTEWLNRYH